jgi:hypothetical protein
MSAPVALREYSAHLEMWIDCGSHGVVPLRQTAPTFVVAEVPRGGSAV